MEGKYFTPEIEDLRVGYECELWEDGQAFVRGRITQIYQGKEDGKECLGLVLGRNGYLIDRFREIKVPYLTKEQIEAEGWTHSDEEFYKKNDYFIRRHGNYLTVREGSWYPEETIFRGECKDINTFRYICKLLNIE